jgi:ABC-type lipoprotein release transport system permease subunit
MSVFNGFESLVQRLFSEFDPDLKITLAEGKSFDISSDKMQQVKKLKDVAVFSPIVEENALVKYGEKQTPAVIKGVSANFKEATNIESIMHDGVFKIKDNSFNYAVAGYGLASHLQMGVSFIEPVSIFAPKRTTRINMARPESSFNQKYLFLSGIFSVKQAEYDENYMIIPIELAREIFEYDSVTATSVELKLVQGAKVRKVQKEIKRILGEEFNVKDRYEQQEIFFRIMKAEKWIAYFILSFILLIAIFNIIGSLSMLILEKQQDITTLRNMGANREQIRRIFLFEGWLISVLGATIGIIIGVGLCLLQQYFNIIGLGGGIDFIIDAYPVKVQFIDVMLIFITVLAMSFLSVLYPIKNLSSTT